MRAASLCSGPVPVSWCGHGAIYAFVCLASPPDTTAISATAPTIGRGWHLQWHFWQTRAERLLWWAAHQSVIIARRPYPEFIPVETGFWWACRWFCRTNTTSTPALIGLREVSELRWLDKHYMVHGSLALLLLLSGGWEHWRGDVVSTVLLFHGTFSINSAAASLGSRASTLRMTAAQLCARLITLGKAAQQSPQFITHATGNSVVEVDVTYTD